MKSKKKLPLLFGTLAAGVVCLTLGVGVITTPSPQTEIKQQSQIIQQATGNVGELRLVSSDGTQSNGVPGQGLELTVSQWSRLNTYGVTNSLSGVLFGSSDDEIWQQIQNDVLSGGVAVHTVTLTLKASDGNSYSTSINVVDNAPIKVDATNNLILKIAGTDFTASSAAQGTVWKGWTGITSSTVKSDMTITGEFKIPMWYDALGATAGGTYISVGTAWAYNSTNQTIVYPNDGLNGYKWVTFDTLSSGWENNTGSWIRWIIIGGGDTMYAPLDSTGTIINNATTVDSSTKYAFGANQVDGLTSNQLLLLLEQFDVCSYFDNSTYRNQYSTSTSITYESNRGYTGLKGAMDLIASRAAVQKYNFSNWEDAGTTITYTLPANDKIADVTLKTSYHVNNSVFKNAVEDTNTVKLFPLAKGNTQVDIYPTSLETIETRGQNYCVESYLGKVTNRYIAYWGNGTSASYWWLRSGSYDYYASACRVFSNGSLGTDTVKIIRGVRPAFVLNLG